MKQLLVIFVLAVLNSTAVGQANRADSLKSILQSNKTEDTNRVTNLLNLSYAIVYENPDSSMNLAEEGLKTAQKLKWQKGIALSLRQKGLVYYFKSDFLQAIDLSLEALKEGSSLKNPLFDASVYNNIANVYADMGQREKALTNYQRLLDIARQNGHRTYEMNAWANMGSIYTELQDYKKAIDAFEKSLLIAKELNDTNIAGVIYNNLGTTYRKTGNHSAALSNFQLAVEAAEPNRNYNVIANSLNNIAQIDISNNNLDSAEARAKRAVEYSRMINSLQSENEAYETLSKLYEKKGLSALAFNAFKTHIQLRDSLLNDEKKQEITRKELKFEADKQEAILKAEHAAALRHQTTIKNASIAGAILLLISGLLVFLAYKKKRDAVSRQQEAELKIEIGETEMKALRSQMNPHFIFNSLNSISDFMLKNDLKTADLYLTRFAKVMRMILENSEKKEVSLKDDLKALELYMQLESARLENKFTYDIRVDSSIDMENTLVPPLILQPFVENSIWHGLAGKAGPGHISIDIRKNGEMIKCIVEDNGVGRSTVSRNNDGLSKTSLGMKITKARIDVLNKVKNTKAAVNISDLSEGMRAEVHLPLELSFTQ